MNNPFARGMIKTRIIGGACHAIDGDDIALSENQRIKLVISKGDK
jgi:hypothetical protein